MKKIKMLPESEFLKLFFGLFSAMFLIAGVLFPERGQTLAGLWQILSQPSKLTCSYFAIGGYGATFLNMGLVGLICLGLFVVFKGKPNNASTLAVLLTLGFGSWGINILNIWPSIFGVMVYCLVKKESFGSQVNAMLFSTGIAPIITDLLIRYPNAEAVGFNLPGVCMALAVGFVIGFFLPAGLAHSPNVHKGFDLYSAAVPIGMTAFFLNAALYKTMGIALPAGADAAQLQVAAPRLVNLFCLILFGLCILGALAMGGSFKDYWKALRCPDRVPSITAAYGNATFLMNVGFFGLFILAYYNLIGATFNGVTFGIIFCMLCTCNSGSHPGNVWPIMVGYVLAAAVCGWIAPVLGGTFTLAINAQAICVGLCYANGLSPICDKYGWKAGIVAAIMHYLLVTSVPNMHGGFCLYNGGFTAALICVLLVPQLERFAKTKDEKKALMQ